MNVDIRVPIGGMFFMIGLILTGYGVVSIGNPEMYAKSLGININLWWGLVLLAFGGSFLFLGWRAEKTGKKE